MYSYPPLANMRTKNVPIGHNVYYSPSSRYGYYNPLAQFNALQADPLAEEDVRREELALNRRLQQLRQSRLGNHYPRSMDPYHYNDRLESLRLQIEEEEQLARLEALRQRQRELEEEEKLMMSIARHRRQLEEEEELLRLSRALRIADEEKSTGRHFESFRPSTAEVSAEHYTNRDTPHPIPSYYYTPRDYLHQHNECGRACCRSQPYCEPSQREPTKSAAQVPHEGPRYARLPAKQVEPLMHQWWPQQSHNERLGKASAPDSNDSQVVDVNSLLKALGVHRPSAETPVEVAKVGDGWPMQKTGEVENKHSEWPRADVKHLETKSVPSAKSIPPCTKTESSDTRSIPIIDLGQFLNMLADASYRGQNEGSKVSPSSSTTSVGSAPQSQPENVLKPLKEQLERRLGGEYAKEIRDTIEGLLTSIRDNKSPETSTSNTVQPLKGTTGTGLPVNQYPPQKAKSVEKEEPKKIPIEVKFERTSRPNKELEAGQRIGELEKRFYALKDQFQFPETLDFVTSTTSSGSGISRLAYTTNNQPARSYAQSLNKLLGELDLIDSQGNSALRMKRKEVVKKVESALEDLEQRVEGRWKAQNEEARKFKTTIEDVTEEEAPENEDKAQGRRSVPGTPGETNKNSPILEEIVKHEVLPNLPATASVPPNSPSLPYDPEFDMAIVDSRSTESRLGHNSDESSSEQAVPTRETEGSDHTPTQEELSPSKDIFEVNDRQDEAVSFVPPSPGMASDLSPSPSPSSVIPDPENIDDTNINTTDLELVESTNESGKEGPALADEVAEQNGISPKGLDSDVESISSEQWSEVEAPIQ